MNGETITIKLVLHRKQSWDGHIISTIFLNNIEIQPLRLQKRSLDRKEIVLEQYLQSWGWPAGSAIHPGLQMEKAD